MSYSGLKDVGPSVPVAQIMRSILTDRGTLTVSELTDAVLDVWSRDFPSIPFDREIAVYKIAVNVLHCKESYENLPEGKAPYDERDIPGSEPVIINPRMSAKVLIDSVQQICDISLTLPN